MMKSNDVSILFTMDVELATTGDGRTSGPASEKVGARRVEEYRQALAACGYTPTYFVHPELGATQGALFRSLRERGAGVGLHVHTVKFGSPPSPCELGGLPAATQFAVIGAAIELFTRDFGFRPTFFRPGCFSANDDTYGVLHALGFAGGGISIPGRVWPERCCVWSGAEPHPHYGHAAFRQLPGTLPFVDIPLSVDRIGGLLTHPLGFQHYADLRPGGVYTEEEDSGRDHLTILRHIIRQLVEEDPALKTIVIDVHNDRDFLDLATASARHLRAVLDGLEPELARVGLRPVNATFDEAIEHYRAASPLPAAEAGA